MTAGQANSRTEIGRLASIEWLEQHLRQLKDWGVRVESTRAKAAGSPTGAMVASRYDQTANRLQVAPAALSTEARYATFASAQRNAFFNIGGYLLTGPESENAEARRRHPRSHRADSTAPELIVRDADGDYTALHHVLARFAERRMTLGHGSGWQQRLARRRGPKDWPGFASVERSGWKAADARTQRLAAELVDELTAALGHGLQEGPRATAEEAAECESWRQWEGSGQGLETKAAEEGLLCRRRSPFDGVMNTRVIRVSEAEIERWVKTDCIQNAMPKVSADDREFLLSGTLPDQWDAAMEALEGNTAEDGG